MPETNLIYEITRQLSSPNVMENEMREIGSLALKHIMDKYFSPISAAVASGRDYCKVHPSKEVNLLEAFRPFVKNSAPIDNLVDALNTIRVFANLADSSPIDATAADTSVHPDGVYEIDENCLISGIQSVPSGFNLNLPILLLLLIISNSMGNINR